MLGTLRAGCVYVPVDPGAPVERNAEIHTDCGVRLTIVEERFEAGYRQATRTARRLRLDVHSIGTVGLGRAIHEWAPNPAGFGPELRVERRTGQSELACILYTSGTTGRHKGWMMSRTAVAALARWCHGLFGVGPSDVFANHAPFHFAMSLFDIYSSFGCGAPAGPASPTKSVNSRRTWST